MSSTDKTKAKEGGTHAQLTTVEVSKRAWRDLLKGKTKEEGAPILANIISAYTAYGEEYEEETVPIACTYVDSANKWRFKKASIEALAAIGHPSEVYRPPHLAVIDEPKGTMRQSVFSGKLRTWSGTRSSRSLATHRDNSQQHRFVRAREDSHAARVRARAHNQPQRDFAFD